jgi:hypothetical protein
MRDEVGDKGEHRLSRFQWRDSGAFDRKTAMTCGPMCGMALPGADRASAATSRGYAVGVGPLPRSSAAWIHSRSRGPRRPKGLWR